MHDATKVLLGTTESSARVATCFPSDPATFLAGLVVSGKNDGTLSLALSDGKRVGVSLGRSLSDTKKTTVCRKGLDVPVRFLNYAHGIVTITSYANLVDDTDDTVEVAGVVFTAQAGAATPGQATFQAATSNTATATSLAAQINAHATSSALVDAWSEGAVVFIRALDEDADIEELTLVYTDIDGTGTSVGATVSGSGTLTAAGSTVAKGTLVYVHDTLGYACDSDDVNATVTNMVYASSSLFDGIAEDSSTVKAVKVNMLKGA